jgi:hypothetical protein
MFRFLLGLTLGLILGALGMAYLWWQDDQQRAEASLPPEPKQP